MPPMVVADDGFAVVNGSYTDLWRCELCKKLWQVRFTKCYPGKFWGRPSLFSKIWYGHRKGIIEPEFFSNHPTQTIPAVDPWENSPIPSPVLVPS